MLRHNAGMNHFPIPPGILPSRRRTLQLLGGLAVSGTVQAAAPQPLRIGVIASWSGPYADYGRQFDAGMAVYLQQHGERLGGLPVELVRRDVPGAAPDLARRAAQELIVRDKVDVLAGLDFSPNAYAVGSIAAQAKVPVVVMNASSSAIPAQSPTAVRVSFTVQQVSAPMAQWAARQGIRQAYTVVADYAPGVDSEVAFHKAFTVGGGTIVGALRVPLGNIDYAAYLQRVRDSKPEAVFFFFPSGVMPPAFLRAWKERGMDRSGIRLLATGEATDDSYLDATGDVALGLVTSHHYSYAHASPKNQRFVRDFQARFGTKLRPGYFAVAAYDGLATIDAALTRAGKDTRGEALVHAMRGLKLESPRGPIEIDAASRDIVQTVYIRRVDRVNGQLVNVEFDKFERVKDPGRE